MKLNEFCAFYFARIAYVICDSFFFHKYCVRAFSYSIGRVRLLFHSKCINKWKFFFTIFWTSDHMRLILEAVNWSFNELCAHYISARWIKWIYRFPAARNTLFSLSNFHALVMELFIIGHIIYETRLYINVYNAISIHDHQTANVTS